MTAPVRMQPVAAHAWGQRRRELLRKVFKPPERLTVSEWAERYRILSVEYSGEAGRWDTSRTPYLREIMDCLSDPLIWQVVVMKGSRLGGTEAALNMLGWLIDQQPCPIIAVLDTIDQAEGWSKEQFGVMLRDTPRLAGKVQDARSRDSGNTIKHKTFPGGSIAIGGANSGSIFRRRSAKVVYGSEIDAWPASSGNDGDGVDLLIKRTRNYAGRKVYLESTPLLKDHSRIEQAFLEGDQRRYHVPCPDCGEFQVLVWENLRYKDLPEPHYACSHCGALIPEEEKFRMVAAGKWIPSEPFRGIASFWINQLYALFDGSAWPFLVDEWHKAQGDDTRLQTFWNHVRGETWEERGGNVPAEAFTDRQIAYASEVPAGVLLLTAAIDVQDDRLELKIVGWGAGLRSWRIAYVKVMGSPTKPETWREADGHLFRTFTGPGGEALKVHTVVVDTGGHHTDEAYAYVRARRGRRVHAIKGSSQDAAPALPRRPSRNNKGGVKLYTVGVNTLKDSVLGRMRIREEGPGIMYFPKDNAQFDESYFKGLTAERAVRRKINGKWIRKWINPGKFPNEPWDLEVYNLAALKLSGWELRLQKKTLPPAPATPAETSAAPLPPPPAPGDDPTPEDPPPRKRRGGGGYLRRGGGW